jgi:hypothetical protein
MGGVRASWDGSGFGGVFARAAGAREAAVMPRAVTPDFFRKDLRFNELSKVGLP